MLGKLKMLQKSLFLSFLFRKFTPMHKVMLTMFRISNKILVT